MSSSKQKTNRRGKIILVIILLVIFLLQILKIYFHDSLATEADPYVTILEKIGELKKENSILQERLLKMQSLTEISKIASESGFVPASYIYLK